MAKLKLKSEQQILGDMIRTILANSPLNDLTPGSVLLTLLQAAAQEDFSQYYQMLQIVRNYNIDTTTGTDLDNRVFEYGLRRQAAKRATGKITIFRESTFKKISTSFYTGFRSRIAGDTEIFVNDASEFPTSGTNTIIIGRGTPNEEEVQYVGSASNPQDNTNYFKITLSTPLTNDHDLEESVILKQGSDVIIPAGTAIQVPPTGRNEAINFETVNEVTLLAGEDKVEDVDIKAVEPGIKGNIGVKAISGESAFPSPPFPGARAENDTAFTSGRDRETDTQLRNRYKAYIQSLSQSTKAGISNAINGLVDPDTAKKVVSSNIILPDNVGEPVKIYIDDGTGFEPSFRAKGEEIILSSANGGEQRLQLGLFPLVKAQVESINPEPYDFSAGNLTLQYTVGNQSESITFFTTDFKIPEAATAEEVVTAINNKATLIEARTSGVGTKIVLSAKADENENIQITGGTANAANLLNFPTSETFTFYLYKNDKLLSKDGETAVLDAANTTYDFSTTKTLQVVVDGKITNTQTVTFQPADFPTPSNVTAAQAAEIINQQLSGATAIDNNGRVRLISNTELSSKSKLLIISPGGATDANTEFGFPTTEVVGKDQDYKLNPDLGVIELTTPLQQFDKLTAGTANTRAFLTASIPEKYSFVGGEILKVEIDGGPTQNISMSAVTDATAQDIADQINAQLVGGKAVTRTVGLDTFLEIRTNTLDKSKGSIKILSGSAANTQLGFPENQLVTNLTPHTAFVESQNSGPYVFVEGETLVVVLDNDPAGKTFVVTMDYDTSITSTSGGSPLSEFGLSGLITVFDQNDDIKDFYLVFKSGPNTTSGTIEKVTNPSGTTFRYFYDTPPTNFKEFKTGDQATFSGLQNAVNNGNFLITNYAIQNTVHPDVLSRSINNPGSLTPNVGDRYIIGGGANTTIHPDDIIDDALSTPPGSPSVGDKYIVHPDAQSTALDPVQGREVDSNNAITTHGFRYLIDGVGLNDFSGHDNQIAEYNGVGTPGWIFYTPNDKEVVFSIADGTYYQFSSGTGTWSQNDWGAQAGKIAEWNGSSWQFSIAADKEVRNVLSGPKLVQYDVVANTWTQNDWGGKATQIAEWNGSAWNYTIPSLNDVAFVTDESLTYQYTGTTWNEYEFWVEVDNPQGSAEAGSTGTGLLQQRRQISAYNGTTGLTNISSPVSFTPTLGDQVIIIPSTKENMVKFLGNKKITSLSGRTNVELSDQATKIQLSSKLAGSDGYIQVTGGSANEELQFSTTRVRGLQAYSYYTGLTKLVHRTVYGDEQDQVSFPGVGAAGVKFQILAPTVQEIALDINVTLQEGISLSAIESDIKTAVISYINNLSISEDVILSKIIDRISEIDGVKDVVINSPTSNVAIAENELARTKASVITIS